MPLPRAITARQLRVFDLETTGVDVETDRVVQFGTATFRNGALLRVEDTLVNPCTPIPMEASNVHNIFDRDVEDAPTFGLVGDTVAHTLAQSEEQVLCGYNALRFDVPLLNAALLACERSKRAKERLAVSRRKGAWAEERKAGGTSGAGSCTRA